MIAKSTNLRAALRSRQRGMLLNPYRFASSSGGSPLELPGLWGAYGISRLIDGYTGPALLARRSSDNATRAIGFNGSFTDLDTTDLASWAGSDSVYVERWYDQKNSNDFLQATTGQQPRIVSAGVYDGFIRFDGTDDRMASVNSSGTPAAITTAMRAWSRSNTTGTFIEKGADINTTNGFYNLTLNNSGTNVMRLGVSATYASPIGQFVVWNATSTPTTSEAAWVIRYDRSLSSASNYAAWRAAWCDGASQSISYVSVSGNPGAEVTFLANPYYIGARSSGVLPGPVNFKSLVIYETNRDADVSTITANI